MHVNIKTGISLKWMLSCLSTVIFIRAGSSWLVHDHELSVPPQTGMPLSSLWKERELSAPLNFTTFIYKFQLYTRICIAFLHTFTSGNNIFLLAFVAALAFYNTLANLISFLHFYICEQRVTNFCLDQTFGRLNKEYH